MNTSTADEPGHVGGATPAWIDTTSTPVEAGGVPARLVCASRLRANAPLILHLHGGAFVARPAASTTPMVARLLAAAGASVITLDYPVAPQHPFPQPLEAAYKALLWVHLQRHALAAGKASLIVAGEEAGGNLAAALALIARDRGRPALAGQILLSPMLDPRMGTASLRDARAGHAQCPLAAGWHQYLPRCADAMHPYAAPLHSQRLRGLPPALVVTSARDHLRDDSLAYASKLRAAEVDTHECMLPGDSTWPDGAIGDHDDRAAVPAWAAPLCVAFEQFFGMLKPLGRRTVS